MKINPIDSIVYLYLLSPLLNEEKKTHTRYADSNVHQCWGCQNRIGEIREGIFIFPECRVCNRYMTYVYEDPCPYFKVL